MYDLNVRFSVLTTWRFLCREHIVHLRPLEIRTRYLHSDIVLKGAIHLAEENERFRLRMTWLRDEDGNLIASNVGDEEDAPEDIDGVIYFSDLQIGSPHDAILVLAAEDVHDTPLRRIELTFEDVHIVLERTEDPATLGDRAIAEQEQRRKASIPAVESGVPLRWH
jgi:hypothetical protein